MLRDGLVWRDTQKSHKWATVPLQQHLPPPPLTPASSPPALLAVEHQRRLISLGSVLRLHTLSHTLRDITAQCIASGLHIGILTKLFKEQIPTDN
ncbi:hypothetical protein NQZ68_013610 [Dissostichus eleginoides]|nr:hypothetical protein NQZ68_013610 [Dissostichus eleginoides]